MRILAWLAAAAIPALPLMAPAAEGIGEVRAVVEEATATGKVGERELAVGASLFVGDRVSTDAAGEAQLVFADGTRTVLGPNSSLVLDEFVFGSGGGNSRFAVRALGGAFRFISGNAPKDAYLIQTPAATIGMRGTAFDFNVSGADLNLLLLERGPPGGGATVCAAGAGCRQVEEVCDLVSADRGRDVRLVEDEAARAEKVRRLFPFVSADPGLDEAFRIREEEGKACIAALAGPQQASAATGGTAPGALPGPGLPAVALGAAGLAAVGVGLGLLAGGDDGSPTTTTTTTTTGTR